MTNSRVIAVLVLSAILKCKSTHIKQEKDGLCQLSVRVHNFLLNYGNGPNPFIVRAAQVIRTNGHDSIYSHHKPGIRADLVKVLSGNNIEAKRAWMRVLKEDENGCLHDRKLSLDEPAVVDNYIPALLTMSNSLRFSLIFTTEEGICVGMLPSYNEKGLALNYCWPYSGTNLGLSISARRYASKRYGLIRGYRNDVNVNSPKMVVRSHGRTFENTWPHMKAFIFGDVVNDKPVLGGCLGCVLVWQDSFSRREICLHYKQVDTCTSQINTRAVQSTATGRLLDRQSLKPPHLSTVSVVHKGIMGGPIGDDMDIYAQHSIKVMDESRSVKAAILVVGFATSIIVPLNSHLLLKVSRSFQSEHYSKIKLYANTNSHGQKTLTLARHCIGCSKASHWLQVKVVGATNKIIELVNGLSITAILSDAILSDITTAPKFVNYLARCDSGLGHYDYLEPYKLLRCIVPVPNNLQILVDTKAKNQLKVYNTMADTCCYASDSSLKWKDKLPWLAALESKLPGYPTSDQECTVQCDYSFEAYVSKCMSKYADKTSHLTPVYTINPKDGNPSAVVFEEYGMNMLGIGLNMAKIKEMSVNSITYEGLDYENNQRRHMTYTIDLAEEVKDTSPHCSVGNMIQLILGGSQVCYSPTIFISICNEYQHLTVHQPRPKCKARRTSRPPSIMEINGVANNKPSLLGILVLALLGVMYTLTLPT